MSVFRFFLLATLALNFSSMANAEIRQDLRQDVDVDVRGQYILNAVIDGRVVVGTIEVFGDRPLSNSASNTFYDMVEISGHLTVGPISTPSLKTHLVASVHGQAGCNFVWTLSCGLNFKIVVANGFNGGLNGENGQQVIEFNARTLDYGPFGFHKHLADPKVPLAFSGSFGISRELGVFSIVKQP